VILRTRSFLSIIRRTVSPLGWTVAGMGTAAWFGARTLAWDELRVIALACIVLWVIAIGSAIGRLDLEASVAVSPARVVVGKRAVGELRIRNRRRRSLRALQVEFPVGQERAPFGFGRIRGGEEVDEQFIVPTHRRAVIPVGPVTTIQGDPLEMVRRPQVWSDVEKIYVHPLTVRPGSLNAGLIRDMEGQATNKRSPSDVAFHTLRDYVPGDDPRHIHWKSSAKLNKLQVRQYVDTRRSNICVVVSVSRTDYASEEEFELAISCGASVASQSMRDGQTLTVFAGPDSLPTTNNKMLLDRWSGVEWRDDGGGVVDCMKTVRRRSPNTSVAVVCTGSVHGIDRVQTATRFLPTSAAALVLRCDLNGRSRLQRVGDSTILTVPNLDVLRSGVVAVAAS